VTIALSTRGSETIRPDYLDKLNAQQRQAVEHGIGAPDAGGPLLVIAGAGSGKTNTLAHRVTHLVVNGADPRKILLLTFSRRAAFEMTRRVERLAVQVLGANSGLGRAALTWAGTFHSIGARLLREYAEHIGLSPSFTIHDREDSADLMNLVRHALGLSSQQRRFPTKHTCMAIYSRAVNTEAPLASLLAATFPWCAGWESELRTLFSAYVEAKQAQQVLDYDDLLLYWARMAAEPLIAADLSPRFDHVLVDEYQDTNRLQASILLALKPDGRGVTVVGDDAQSIYSFRGATVRNILEFPAQFAPHAQIVTLERNYRSTPAILAACNAVIGLAAQGFAKQLWSDQPGEDKPQLVTVRDEAEQAGYVTESVLASREGGMTLKTQAVLFRASHHSAQLEVELTRRNVPFVKFGGLKFLDASHIKDLLAVLRWLENPRDQVAGFRVLQLLPGIGPGTAARVLDSVAQASDTLAAMQAFVPPVRAVQPWSDWLALAAQLAAHGTHPGADPGIGLAAAWPGEFELIAAWYEPHLQRMHEDAPTRLADIAQLQQIAATYPSRERFLTELTLDKPDATSDESGVPLRDEDYLILSTIHSAKGQEWRSVYLLNAVDGCLPSDLGTGTTEDLEEERRLLYVAMTRAKEQLQIVVPQRFYVHQQAAQGDRHVYASRTRFIPPKLLSLFDSRAWPAAAPVTEQGRRALAQARIDIAGGLRGMWK
jgi:DNA helicase-2/ATP-dependent DNA helicase PcrA